MAGGVRLLLLDDYDKAFQGQTQGFAGVMAVECPPRGIWSLSFITGEGLRSFVEQIENEFLTVSGAHLSDARQRTASHGKGRRSSRERIVNVDC